LAARCLTDFLARLAACLVLAMVAVCPDEGTNWKRGKGRVQVH
jgi:hypothetical protein